MTPMTISGANYISAFLLGVEFTSSPVLRGSLTGYIQPGSRWLPKRRPPLHHLKDSNLDAAPGLGVAFVMCRTNATMSKLFRRTR